MATFRNKKEIDELVELTRAYCATLADLLCAKAEWHVTLKKDIRRRMERSDEKIIPLKTRSKRARRRSLTTNIIPMAQFKRKVAR